MNLMDSERELEPLGSIKSDKFQETRLKSLCGEFGADSVHL